LISAPTPARPAAPVGVFGGTFDPIHYGHLRPAQEAYRRLGLSELRFIPAAAPPLRAPPVASGEQRRAMVERAIRGHEGFRLDDRELRRGGPSYTVTTLESLRVELGSTPMVLLLGMDQFLGFERWHRWQEIPELAHLVVLSRPGLGSDPWPPWAAARKTDHYLDLGRRPAGRLAFLAVEPQDISATRIRAAVARGEPIDRWVPAAVQDYILSMRLYGRSDRGD
jgi:nicotinate-nucleotide adenylyltransferase